MSALHNHLEKQTILPWHWQVELQQKLSCRNDKNEVYTSNLIFCIRHQMSAKVENSLTFHYSQWKCHWKLLLTMAKFSQFKMMEWFTVQTQLEISDYKLPFYVYQVDNYLKVKLWQELGIFKVHLKKTKHYSFFPKCRLVSIDPIKGWYILCRSFAWVAKHCFHVCVALDLSVYLTEQDKTTDLSWKCHFRKKQQCISQLPNI